MFVLLVTGLGSLATVPPPIPPVYVPVPRTFGNGVLSTAPGGADPYYYNNTFKPSMINQLERTLTDHILMFETSTTDDFGIVLVM